MPVRTRLRLAPLPVVLAAGLAFRLVLALGPYRGHGFATDMRDFQSWAEGVARVGPGRFYGSNPGANYPPASIDVLWLLHAATSSVAHLFGWDPARTLVASLKLPAILADVGVAALVYRAARWRFDAREATVAAAVYLAVPIGWYDAAVWGQLDSVLALASLGALVCLAEGRDELAAALATVALLVKPQGIVCVVIVAVGLACRYVRRSPRARRTRGPLRPLAAAASALLTVVVLAVPYDLQSLAPSGVARIPLLGDLVGLGEQMVRSARLFSVLTANAYNVWALAGPTPLATSISTGRAVWWPDDVHVLGLPAVVWGAIGLAVIGTAVLFGLVRRLDGTNVLLAYVVLSVGFFVLPTRVHERYLAPAFAVGAALVAGSVWRVAGYVVVAVANWLNLHAVLAAPLAVVTGAAERGANRAPDGATPTIPRGSSGLAPTQVRLPWAAFARSSPVVDLVVAIHLLALTGLLAIWLRTTVFGARGRAVAPPARAA